MLERGADRSDGKGHGAILVSVGRCDIWTICPGVRQPATEATEHDHVFLPCCGFGLCQRAGDATGGGKQVVPPTLGSGSRARWVTTNTGARNGGSSPQSPTPTPNIRLPTRNAPAVWKGSSLTLAFAGLEFIHWWRRSPPSPSGFATETFGPVANPSSEIEWSAITFPMSPLLILKCLRRFLYEWDCSLHSIANAAAREE